MNLKDQLTEKKNALMALKEKIEAGDDEAIKYGESISNEIEDLNAKIASAEKAQAMLSKIGSEENEKETNKMAEEVKARNIGENFVKTLKRSEHGKRFDVVAPEFKANTDVQKMPASASAYATDLDRNVVTAPREGIVIRDLFGAETISGNALTYLVEGAMEGEPAVTAEGALKPQVHFADPTPVTVSLKKIAEFIKESDEYIADYKFLESAINGRLMYALQLKEQNELVADLVGTSGIQTGTFATADAATLADTLFGAATDVQTGSGYAADAIVMNPATWQILRLGKDKNGAYYGGGYFADGQGKQIWGIPVVTTTAVTAKQIIVGAFKTCGSVVQKGGVTVESTNSNEDDFVKNLMTIRAEERLALAVRRPAGFKLLTTAA